MRERIIHEGGGAKGMREGIKLAGNIIHVESRTRNLLGVRVSSSEIDFFKAFLVRRAERTFSKK